jgi:serine/threonine-protein kinase
VQSQDLIARFVREGKAVARISHPHVIEVFDVGVHENTPFLVMELLEGEDLASMLESRSPMRAEEIADLIIPVLSALASAHEAGVIHRDLKPDNVFVSRGKGGTLVPKLLDFGISKLEDGQALQLTGTNAILGTPYYMSPEQAGSSKQVDHRSDVFSMGVILYQCATRELPFKGESLFQLLGQILHTEPPPMHSITQNLPPTFEAIVARAMQKDPAKRFQTAAALGAALLPLASQRVRLAYEHELGDGGIATSETLAAVHVSEAQRTPMPATNDVPTEAVPQRSKLGLAIAAVVLVLAGLAFALTRSSSEQDVHVAAPAPEASAVEPPPIAPDPVPQVAAAVEPIAVVPDAGARAQPSVEPVPEPPEVGRGARAKPRPRKGASEKPKPTQAAVPTPAPQPSKPEPAPTADDLFRDRK